MYFDDPNFISTEYVKFSARVLCNALGQYGSFSDAVSTLIV